MFELNVGIGIKIWIKEKEPKKWFFHRVKGPAIEQADGKKIWYLNGEKHRIPGPAVEHSNGDKDWWVHGFPTSSERSNCKYDISIKEHNGEEVIFISNWEAK
ncbi:MAG: hypothetical protein EKK64_06220 [Neisseriaceae bacterium]|nr:MAG: hypothetical protein EKK64_06220 [Neisseriaceae bacterium]